MHIFGITLMLAPNISLDMFPLPCFGNVYKVLALILKCLVELIHYCWGPLVPGPSLLFFFFYIIKFIFLLVIGILFCSVFPWLNLDDCMFLVICPVLLDCPICCYIIDHNTFLETSSFQHRQVQLFTSDFIYLSAFFIILTKYWPILFGERYFLESTISSHFFFYSVSSRTLVHSSLWLFRHKTKKFNVAFLCIVDVHCHKLLLKLLLMHLLTFDFISCVYFHLSQDNFIFSFNFFSTLFQIVWKRMSTFYIFSSAIFIAL